MAIDTRVVALGTGLVTVALLAGGWFLGAQPQLDAAAAADSAASQAATTNQALQVKLAGLSKLGAREEALKQEDAELQRAVPSILRPNTFIHHVNQLAALDLVSVTSITLGDAAAYTPPASAAGPAGAAGAAPKGAEPAETTPAAATTGAAPAVKLAATDPLVTPANFSVVPTTVVVRGTASAIRDFSRSMQQDERVFLISSFSTSDDSGTTVGTLAGYIYTLKR